VINQIKSEVKITFKLALPIVIGQLGIMLMGVADTIQVGHMQELAKESVGAAGIGNSIFITMAIIGIIALQIVAPMMANANNQQDYGQVNSLYNSSIKVALMLGAICFVLIEIIALNFHLLHQKPEIEELTKPYLHIIAISIFPMLLFTAIKQLSDGLGNTKIAMNISLIALVVNILFNYLLINGIGIFPKLGLFGAGIATLIARISMALGLYFYLKWHSQFKNIFMQASSNIKESGFVRRILIVGIPSGLQGFFEIAVFSAAAIFIGRLGTVQLAAHEVAINPASITYMMVTGLAAAGGIRVGTHLGDRKLMKLSGSVALLLGFGFMFLTFLAFLLFSTNIAKLYIADPQVIPMAATLIFIAGFFQLSDGIQAVALGILRGMADVNIPTIATLIAYWGVGLPIGYFLAFNWNMGAVGIWIGLSAGLTASAMLLTWRFYHNLDKMKSKKMASSLV
jgi:multidrug resistance protein, MATE family